MKERFLKNGLLTLAAAMLLVFAVSSESVNEKVIDGNATAKLGSDGTATGNSFSGKI